MTLEILLTLLLVTLIAFFSFRLPPNRNWGMISLAIILCPISACILSQPKLFGFESREMAEVFTSIISILIVGGIIGFMRGLRK